MNQGKKLNQPACILQRGLPGLKTIWWHRTAPVTAEKLLRDEDPISIGELAAAAVDIGPMLSVVFSVAAAAMSIIACAWFNKEMQLHRLRLPQETLRRKEQKLRYQDANFFRRNSIIHIDSPVVKDGELRGDKRVQHHGYPRR